jgi:hypothetical protein
MAIYFDQNGNLVDTEINESSNVFMEDPTENFYQPRADISPTQDFYPPSQFPPTSYGFINVPQSYYPSNDISPTQDFYQPREFVNAPQTYYQPDLTTLRGLPNLDLQSLPANMGVANEPDVKQVDSLTGEKKSNGILDLIMSIAVPGYNFLKNMGSGKSYEFTDPRGSFRKGIYTMDGVNYSNPASFGGEFFDRSTNTNRFDRAKNRFRDSRSKRDLFAASRTGAEFSNAKKILNFQNQPGNYQTNFMDRAKSERNFTGQAPKGTTAFDTKSGMGRRGFYKGGIASLYGQNN